MNLASSTGQHLFSSHPNLVLLAGEIVFQFFSCAFATTTALKSEITIVWHYYGISAVVVVCIRNNGGVISKSYIPTDDRECANI